jgi:hypothetical protein
MPTIRIGAQEYDVNKDFTWRELLTVEELAGYPLAEEKSFNHMAVIGAFVFVIQKRDDASLMWEGFLDSSIMDITGGDDDAPADAQPAAKAKAKPRPTKSA